MTLNDYLSLFKRYWGIILLFTLCSTTLMALWMGHVSPVYEASCKLLIVDATSSTLGNQKDMILGTLGKSDPITTQVEVMRTWPIYEEVIKQCNLRDKEGEYLNPTSFEEKFTIQAVRLSNIVNVSYRSGNADSAANVVNTLVKVVEELNQKLNREEVRNMRLFIEQQLDGQKTRLEEIEQASVNFKKKERTVAIDLQTSSQINTAAGIEAEVMRLEGERQGVLAQQRQLEGSLNVPRAQADPFYVSKLNMYEQAKTKLSSIEAQKAALVRQLRSINYQLSSRPQEEVNLTRFLRDEKIAEKTYTDLLSKLQELEIKEAAKTASIKLVEPAVASEFPVYPKKKKSVAIAMLAGLFLGCGIAYAIAFLKGHPYSISTIKSILPYDILGTVPVVKKKGLFFFRESPNAHYTESIRHIHTNMDFKGVYHAQHVNCLVTSASAGEGKRIVCANLAYTLAETGRKTVLVNLDLRRNVFNELFKPETTKGVTDYLADTIELQEILTHYPEYDFSVIDAGKVTPTPARVFLRGRINEFFTVLANNYDVCLFYGAPILTASETLDLSRYMNGIVLVTDMNVSDVKSITAMNELLANKGLPILGTVVNRMNSRV
jgi:tyrosine-protein kinase Etk/Wzc